MCWPDLSQEQKAQVVALLFGENGFAKLKRGKAVAGDPNKKVEWSESEEEQEVDADLPAGKNSEGEVVDREEVLPVSNESDEP